MDKFSDRLKSLHKQRQQSRVENHQLVIEENARFSAAARSKKSENAKKKLEYIQNEEKQRQQAIAEGKDYERMKMLNASVDDVVKKSKKYLKRKSPDDPDDVVDDFQAATERQYRRLVKTNLEKKALDMEWYKEQMKAVDQFSHLNPKDRQSAIDAMAADVDAQAKKRAIFSRRRTHNDDADIDYINEKNARFNQRLEKAYGSYTTEIKQNLERGTAV